jgi:CheY-like chemotaxis protein
VLVFAKDVPLVDRIVKNLKAYDLRAFGETSVAEAIHSMRSLEPEVVVADPTSEECIALLQDKNDRKSIVLVAVVESEESAQKAAEMGIDEVFLCDDDGAIADAVLDRLQQPPSSAVGARILIVDDEPEIREILSNVLSRQGYTVIEAKSGKEALELVDQGPEIDLVLLDLILPQQGGIEILKELKSRHPQLAVIMMSGLADAEIVRFSSRLGAFDFITKPIDYSALYERVIAGLASAEFHRKPWWKRFRAKA